MSIYVTNNGDKTFSGNFDYKVVDFPVGETVEISVECAMHLFGYGVDNKYDVLVRNNWLKMSNEMDKAMSELAKFSFNSEPPRKNHLSPVIERVVPMPSNKGGKGAKAQRAA